MTGPSALDTDRLQRLIAVGRSLLSELSVELVLDRLLEVARELTGARYAAIGILDDRRRSELARFVTRGIDAKTQRAIGDLPRGRGILGVVIDDPQPLRLHDVSEDPRSYGFPIGHPPMRTFLGVPVIIRGEAWGNLYLTEKAGGEDFDEADEESGIVLSAWAAIAIENARLYEALDMRAGELERAVRGFEATAAIAEAVGAETELVRLLELIVKRARALVEARGVLVLLAESDGLRVAAAAGQVTQSGAIVPLQDSVCADAVARREPIRVDDVDREDGLDSDALGVPDASSALIVPLVYRGRALGVLVAFDRMREPMGFDREDEQVMRAFAASAATAVATARSVEEHRLRAALQSAEAERRRWARELHDETLQALGGLKVMLSSATRADDLSRVREVLHQSIDHVSREIANLRAIITELRPASLDQLGLEPALETLAQRVRAVEGLDVEATIELDPGDNGLRLSPELETAIYRVAQEALTNVAKHAGAHRVSLSVRREDGMVRLEVADDGRGIDVQQPSAGFGLVGMRERVALAGGTLDVRAANPGTRIEASFPVTP